MTEAAAFTGDSLRRTLRDLVALSILPTVWQTASEREVLEGLCEVLQSTLGLELVYLKFEGGDVARTARRPGLANEAEAIRVALSPFLGAGIALPETLANPVGEGPLRPVRVPVSSKLGEHQLVVASRSALFPSLDERLLLAVAVSYASVALDRVFALQEQREHAERVLATVSHEIRTPMNAVLGMTELTLESPLTEEQRGWLRAVKSAGEHLLVIVEGLLDFSKAEADKIRLEIREFSLRSELSALLGTLALRAQRQGLELLCEIEDEVPDRLLGDAGRLRQILSNLIDNALKFTRRGEVELRVARGAEHAGEMELAFEVRDTGLGIPASQHALIFEAFGQADASTTRRYGGTGLGLTIAVALARLMQGNITVESEIDRGSVFTLRARFGRVEQVHVAQPCAAWSGLRALVVDANDASRTRLTDWLRSFGIAADGAEDGAIALSSLMRSAALDQAYDLVLVDQRSPGVTSFDSVPELPLERVAHGLRLRRFVPAPASAFAAAPAAPEVLLAKPVLKHQLRAALSTLLESKRALASRSEVTRPEASDARRELRVLVAEDNEFNAQLLRDLLARRGHAVEVASNGREALARLDADRFDLLLLDLHLPEADGFEVIRRLREREAGVQHLPTIALTARAREADRERCLAAGMDAFLTKPINSAALWSAIEALAPAR